MSTVAKYLRISTEDLVKETDADSCSIVNQRHLLDSFLDEQEEFEGWKRIELCDDGWSGTNFDRPGVKKLLELVKQGRVQCIVVKDISRFGRNYIETGNYISKVFPFMGVRFISLGDCYDSSRPSDLDSLSVSFSTIIYDLYSKELSEKVRTAKDRLAEGGDYLAPAAPYGYVKDPSDSKHLVIDEDAAGIVRHIFHMLCDGKSSSSIARHLNSEGVDTPMQHKQKNGCQWLPWTHISDDIFWTDSTVRKIIQDERYCGDNIYGKHRRTIVGNAHVVKAPRDKWIIVPNTHKPIIDRELFAQAQKLIRRQSGSKALKSTHFLSRKVYCGVCGHAMSHNRSKDESFFCRTPLSTDRYNCPTDLIHTQDILDAVLTSIRSYARLAVDLDQILTLKRKQQQSDRKGTLKKIKNLQRSRERAERHLQEMYEMLVEGEITKDDYLSRKESLSTQLAEISSEIERLEAALAQKGDSDAERSIALFRSYDGIDTLAEDNIRELLNKVIIYPGNAMEIKLNFTDELSAIAATLGIQIDTAV